jgi:hypothetical protein
MSLKIRSIGPRVSWWMPSRPSEAALTEPKRSPDPSNVEAEVFGRPSRIDVLVMSAPDHSNADRRCE